jgi:hypothetical protein
VCLLLWLSALLESWLSSILVLVGSQGPSTSYPSSILPSRGCQSWPHTEACFCPQVWLDLGSRWPTYQICSLHTRSYQVPSLEVCWDLHCSRVMLARGSEDDHFLSRVIVCHSLLGATACTPRESLNSQFSLSPADGGPNCENQPNSRRYAQSLRDRISWWLGQKSAMGWVLIQQ